LIELYQKAWLFCLPSTYEGFGVPYIEAMACGTPAVATANPGAEEVLCGGEYGPIVEDDKLAAALLGLLRNAKLRSEYRQKGLAYVRQYSWENIIHEYKRLYDLLLNRGVR
jgi:glycosyltransferase involved in cell wall biosynthesis